MATYYEDYLSFSSFSVAAIDFTPTSIVPTLPTLQLTAEEVAIATDLAGRLMGQAWVLELTGRYYDGLQPMTDLGISLPPEMKFLRAVTGWPSIGVDAVSERLRLQGFRYPDSPDVDADLMDIADANNYFSEASLAHLDAMIYGRSYLVVGSSQDNSGMPVITPESAMNLAVHWNPATRTVDAALQVYRDAQLGSDTFGQQSAVLYLPEQTIYLAKDAKAGWVVTSRDAHNLGEVTVVRMANRPRIANRTGASEITPAVMNITDRACRTLLSLEVSREFYAAPQRYILGASESDFQDSAGNTKSAWQTYLGRVLALERDGDGNVPAVGQFQAYDPSAYLKLLDGDAKMLSGITGLPPHYYGVTSDANPTSADAIRSSDNRIDRRATDKLDTFGLAHRQTLRLALLVRDGKSAMPDNAHRIACEWADVATPTPAATADALTKYIAAGAIPATSDVTLAKAGFSPVERIRLAIDRDNDEGLSLLQEIAHNNEAKAIKAENTIVADAAKADAAAPVGVTPTPPASAKPAS